MLYINNVRWHVGEPLLAIYEERSTARTMQVQADGDELLYVLSHIKNIPHTDGAVIIWRGDLAWFIVDNLFFRKGAV